MQTNVYIKSKEEFQNFKNVVRILKQKFHDNVMYKGTESSIYDPENPYYSFEDSLPLVRQCWMKASLEWINYQKEKTILSFDEFNEKFNPYNDLTIIDKAAEFIKDKDCSEEYLNGLFNGYIEGIISKQIEKPVEVVKENQPILIGFTKHEWKWGEKGYKKIEHGAEVFELDGMYFMNSHPEDETKPVKRVKFYKESLKPHIKFIK